MTNLIVAPEDFSNVNWSTILQGVVNTNQVLAPDGTLTADQLVDNNASGSGQAAIQQSVTMALDTEYLISIFLAPSGLSWSLIRLLNIGSLALSGYYDQGNGLVGAGSGDINSSGLEGPYNGGGPDFYRAWFQFTSDSVDTSGNFRINSADADGDIIIDLDGTSSIYLWGASLVEGTTLQPYEAESGEIIGADSKRNIIAVSWRRADQMRPKQRMAKPKRGLFK